MYRVVFTKTNLTLGILHQIHVRYCQRQIPVLRPMVLVFIKAYNKDLNLSYFETRHDYWVFLFFIHVIRFLHQASKQSHNPLLTYKNVHMKTKLWISVNRGLFKKYLHRFLFLMVSNIKTYRA